MVVLDPGHDGGNAARPEIINRLVDAVTMRKACDTTGAQTASGYAEHAFAFDVAQRAAALLRQWGARVVLTRGSDTGVGPCITERAAVGNAVPADAAVSIHADGGPVGGTGFHVIRPGGVGPNDRIVAASARLGALLRDAYRGVTGEPYSNYAGQQALVVRTDLGGLNLSVVPKVFIECANLRNPPDAGRAESPWWRQLAALGIARGVADYLARH